MKRITSLFLTFTLALISINTYAFSYNPNSICINFGVTFYGDLEEITLTYKDYGNFMVYDYTNYEDRSIRESTINKLNKLKFTPIVACNRSLSNKIIEVRTASTLLCINGFGECYLSDVLDKRYVDFSLQSVIAKIENLEELDLIFDELKDDSHSKTLDDCNEHKLTRGEMVSLMSNVVDRLTGSIPIVYYEAPLFNDISDKKWISRNRDFSCCYELGIIKGTVAEGGIGYMYISPDDEITYKDFCAIMARAFSYFNKYKNCSESEISFDATETDCKAYLRKIGVLSDGNDGEPVLLSSAQHSLSLLYQTLSQYVSPNMFVDTELYSKYGICNWYWYTDEIDKAASDDPLSYTY